MVTKKMQTRDYLRTFVTKANKAAGVNFNSSKLNSKEECEEYILNLIKDLKNKTATTKDSTELQVEIKKFESKQAFYETQAKEAGKQREAAENSKKIYKSLYETYHKLYSKISDRCFNLWKLSREVKKKLALSNFLLTSATVFIILEFITIMLLLRGA